MDEETRTDISKEEPATPAATPSPPAFDPAMIARIASMLGTMQASTPSASTTAAESTPVNAPSATANPLGGDGLVTLLSNPAMLEKLPQIMAMLKPLLEAQASVPASASPSSQSTAVATSAHAHMTDRDNLLLALKPFLSSGRRDAVDSILRIAKLGELFKNMQ